MRLAQNQVRAKLTWFISNAEPPQVSGLQHFCNNRMANHFSAYLIGTGVYLPRAVAGHGHEASRRTITCEFLTNFVQVLWAWSLSSARAFRARPTPTAALSGFR